MGSTMSRSLDRRSFLVGALAGAGALALPAALGAAPRRREYRGPNVILVRFGGGVRRRETIDPDHTFAPYLRHELAPRGTLFTDMRITSDPGIQTGHGQGTLNLLVGRYRHYEDVDDRFLGERYEASDPTLFEYLRRSFRVAPHEAMLINGEDRTDEEFYSFSNHHAFGVDYRCSVLSLYRFKCYLLRRQLGSGTLPDEDLAAKQKELAKLEAVDYRSLNRDGQGREIEAFWKRWRAHYGESGFVNPRRDRLLTELAVRALRELRPRLLMINYNDPDYVHWGNMSHYTRGISIIDEGLHRLVDTVEADPFYRGNTVFAIAPDCGRDSNRYMAVPCQHHFNSPSSREIFALLFGPGVARGQRISRTVQQIDLAPTVGHLIGLRTTEAEGSVLREALL